MNLGLLGKEPVNKSQNLDTAFLFHKTSERQNIFLNLAVTMFKSLNPSMRVIVFIHGLV